MSQLTLRFSVVEKNERGQEVELVRKALQFKPQVRNSCIKIDVNTNSIRDHCIFCQSIACSN